MTVLTLTDMLTHSGYDLGSDLGVLSWWRSWWRSWQRTTQLVAEPAELLVVGCGNRRQRRLQAEDRQRAVDGRADGQGCLSCSQGDC